MKRIAALVPLALLVASACGETLPAATEPADSGPAADAAIDAGAPTDATDASSDASACPVLRDDFDRTPADVAQGWTVVNDGGSVSAETAMPWNGTSLRAHTDDGASVPAPHSALLAKNLDPAPKSVRCTFKLRLDTIDPNAGYVDAISLEAIADDGRLSKLRLAVQHDAISIREDVFDTTGTCTGCPTGATATRNGPVPVSQWVTISFFTDFTNADVRIDGVLATAGSFVGFVPKTVRLKLGVVNFSGTAADYSYDDLVCELGC